MSGGGRALSYFCFVLCLYRLGLVIVCVCFVFVFGFFDGPTIVRWECAAPSMSVASVLFRRADRRSPQLCGLNVVLTFC